MFNIISGNKQEIKTFPSCRPVFLGVPSAPVFLGVLKPAVHPSSMLCCWTVSLDNSKLRPCSEPARSKSICSNLNRRVTIVANLTEEFEWIQHYFTTYRILHLYLWRGLFVSVCLINAFMQFLDIELKLYRYVNDTSDELTILRCSQGFGNEGLITQTTLIQCISHSFQDTELKLHRYINNSWGQVTKGLTNLCFSRGFQNEGLITHKSQIQHAFVQFCCCIYVKTHIEPAPKTH